MKNLVRDEKGAALILALILLLIGGLISAALLNHMGSGILAGEVHERRTAELYTADAGVEDAIWKLKHGETPVCLGSPEEWSYPISDINGRNVTVYIEYDVDLENGPKIIGEEGNVIKIDFNTKTEGSA